ENGEKSEVRACKIYLTFCVVTSPSDFITARNFNYTTPLTVNKLADSVAKLEIDPKVTNTEGEVLHIGDPKKIQKKLQFSDLSIGEFIRYLHYRKIHENMSNPKCDNVLGMKDGN